MNEFKISCSTKYLQFHRVNYDGGWNRQSSHRTVILQVAFQPSRQSFMSKFHVLNHPLAIPKSIIVYVNNRFFRCAKAMTLTMLTYTCTIRQTNHGGNKQCFNFLLPSRRLDNQLSGGTMQVNPCCQRGRPLRRLHTHYKCSMCFTPIQ